MSGFYLGLNPNPLLWNTVTKLWYLLSLYLSGIWPHSIGCNEQVWHQPKSWHCKLLTFAAVSFSKTLKAEKTEEMRRATCE